MTWQAGQSGNPRGAIPTKLMRDALKLALNEYKEDEKGNSVKRIRLVTNALVSRAEDGDVPAIKEILDRMDGRVPNDITVRRPNDLPATTFEELAQGVAEALLKLRDKDAQVIENTDTPTIAEPTD